MEQSSGPGLGRQADFAKVMKGYLERHICWRKQLSNHQSLDATLVEGFRAQDGYSCKFRIHFRIHVKRSLRCPTGLGAFYAWKVRRAHKPLRIKKPVSTRHSVHGWEVLNHLSQNETCGGHNLKNVAAIVFLGKLVQLTSSYRHIGCNIGLVQRDVASYLGLSTCESP